MRVFTLLHDTVPIRIRVLKLGEWGDGGHRKTMDIVFLRVFFPVSSLVFPWLLVDAWFSGSRPLVPSA